MDHPDRPPDQARGLRAYKWRAFVAIGLSFVTLVMATSMVFVLLTAIADDFGVTLRAVGWVVIIEALIVSALLLPLGGAAYRIGRRRVYLVGLGVFGVGSVLTGLAPTFGLLIAARMVMALGNALVQSVVTGMLVAAFPREERGRAVGAQTTAVSIGAAAGPLVGGLALQVVPWEWLFLFLAVPVALSMVAAVLILDDDRSVADDRPRTLDAIGGLLSAAAVVVLVVTISNPFALSWLSLPILSGGLVVVALLWAFVRWELRVGDPMLELRLFAGSVFRNAVLVRLLGFTAYTTTTLLLPIFLLSLRGLADGLAGVTIFLAAVGMGTAAQISGNLSDRVGPRASSVAGLALQTVLAVGFASFAADTSMVLLAPVVFLSGFATGLWNVPANSAMMGSVPPQSFAVVGAFTNVTRTMGNVLGQAITAAVVVAVMGNQGFDIPLSEIAETAGAGRAFLDGWRAAYAVVIAVSAVGVVFAFRLPSSPEEVRPAEGASGPDRQPIDDPAAPVTT